MGSPTYWDSPPHPGLPGDPWPHNAVLGQYFEKLSQYGNGGSKILVCPSDGSLTSFSGDESITSYIPCGGSQGMSVPPPGDGAFHIHRVVKIEQITDGTSSTFLFTETSYTEPNYLAFSQGWLDWMAPTFADYAANWSNPDMLSGAMGPINVRFPTNPPSAGEPAWVAMFYQRAWGYGSEHGSGANFAFADGSVRFLKNETNLSTLETLSTTARGEMVPGDY